MPDIEHPWAILVFLAGVPVVVRWWRQAAAVPVGRDWGAPVAAGTRLEWTPLGLRLAALLALTAAAAGPSRIRHTAVTEGTGVAVMLVVDVSPSMGAEMQPGRTRLAAAREESARFLDRRPGDAVGLVTFGREAIVRTPPSPARDALLAALDAAAPGDLGEGTALGTALGLAADRLRAVEAPSRVIVLVTDGESNAGVLDPSTAARAARALGQRLHVVDVSTDEAARAALVAVARAGGGLHRRAGDAMALDRAYREIDALERSPFHEPGREASTSVAEPFLWGALLLLIIERALGASRWGTLP